MERDRLHHTNPATDDEEVVETVESLEPPVLRLLLIEVHSERDVLFTENSFPTPLGSDR